jgi:hypothetical protein
MHPRFVVVQPPRKDNMSKEMKQRLRKEYTGLGGAESKVSDLPCLARALLRGPYRTLGTGSKLELPRPTVAQS